MGERRAAWAALAAAVLLAAALHAPGFQGFWLGDDLPNLHRTHEWAQAGTLWRDTARQFAEPITGGGSFIRPMVIASFSLNYALSGASYAGWYALNFAVHLANVALIALIVLRLARRLDARAGAAAFLAAALFAASPVLAEGVYWVSARADGFVTLCALAAVAAWFGDEAKGTRHGAWAAPALLAVALGFKESAAVMPLQLALVALAWPAPRPRGMGFAVAACFVVMALYFGLRMHLFGSPFGTYLAGENLQANPIVRLLAALQSIPAWWSGLSAARPTHAALHVGLLGAGLLALLAACRGARLRFALAFLAAGAGQLAATLLNLGGFWPTGEGGRLVYGPIGWLCLGLGVLLAVPRESRPSRARTAGLVLLAGSLAAGAVALRVTIREVSAAQDTSRALVAALREWAESRNTLTMVVVPENQGPIVLYRNGQGGLVLPPVQPRPILHLVIPSLPFDIPGRYDGFAQGLATRLGKVVPANADPATLRELAKSDEARWPPVVCWMPGERRFIELPAADPSDRDRWIRETRFGARACLPGEPSFRAP